MSLRHLPGRLSPFLFFVTVVWAGLARGATYYIDFGSGDDARLGTSRELSWKHAPGDRQAAGKAASTKLVAGDIVQFRGGIIYRGGLVVASGAAGQPIIYRGTGWGEGRAIVDGSEPVTGWRNCGSAAEAYGNPKFANLWYAEVEAASAFLLNLHEVNPKSGEDEFLWISQDPNPKDPFFHDRKDSFYTVARTDLTTNTIVSSQAFTSSDPNYYKSAFLLFWGNPNWTKRYAILNYQPADKKITFSDVGAAALYPDKRDQAFAIYNSPNAIDQPGEYFVSEPNASGKRRILVWPRSAGKLDERMSRSVRYRGFDLGKQSHVQIEGFEIRKFAGEDDAGGCGIATASRGVGPKSDYLLRNNKITHNMSGGKGYGGIFLDDVKDAIIEDNEVLWVKDHRAIFVTKGENVIIRHNRVAYTGRTAVVMYDCKKSQIINNQISHILATHANAITAYIACENILIAGNVVTDSTSPLTFQDSGPIYVFNNVMDGGGKYKNVNEWPNTHRGPWATGDIVILNNTFVHAEASVSLSLGGDPAKKYVVINNILDGLATKESKGSSVLRENNLYLALNTFQSPKYNWTLGPGESVAANALSVFVNPIAFDFRLTPDGPAIGKGVDVSKYYPKAVFPDVNFDALAGVTKSMNIGATPPAETTGAKEPTR